MIKLIAAHDEGFVIGNKGRLPWNIPTDLEFFKARTDGCVVIMGRKTWDSIGKPLSNRINIVITNRHSKLENGIWCEPSLTSAVVQAKTLYPALDIFVIGGESLYREALEKDLVNEIILTVVEGKHEGDVFFPHDAMDRTKWVTTALWPKMQDKDGKDDGCVRLSFRHIRCFEQPSPFFLQHNMRFNNKSAVVETRNSWKHTTFLEKEDVVLDGNGNVVARGSDYYAK